MAMSQGEHGRPSWSAIAEWSSSAARRVHNPKVAGSNPASATMDGSRSGYPRRFAKPVWAVGPSRVRIPPHPLPLQEAPIPSWRGFICVVRQWQPSGLQNRTRRFDSSTTCSCACSSAGQSASLIRMRSQVQALLRPIGSEQLTSNQKIPGSNPGRGTGMAFPFGKERA